MANLHLVTGYAGQSHVTAADDGSFNAAIIGSGQYVLHRGSEFAATILSNNSIRVADGDLLIQGRHVRLNEGSYVDLTIENGTQSNSRNDLIVARYTKNSITGVEDCNLVVIQGTATTGTPTDPEYIEGDIIEGHALTADFPLYRVPLNGLNVQTPVPLFTVLNSVISDITSKQDETNKLTAETAIANGDYFPFYDTSAGRNRKTLWSNILAKLKIGTTNINDSAVTEAKLAFTPATLNTGGKVEAGQSSSPILTKTTSFTPTIAEAGVSYKANSTSTITVTIPTNESQAFPVDTEIEVFRYNTGAVKFAPASGVTLRSPDGLLSIAPRYAWAVAKKIGTNEWSIAGGLE